MYIRVYAPNGEPFDVTRERADKLILQDGWTQTQPQPTPEPQKVDFSYSSEKTSTKSGRKTSTRLKRR